MTINFVGSTPGDLGGATIDNTTTNARDVNFTPLGSRVYGDFDETGAGFSINFPLVTGDLWVHFLNHFEQVAANNHGDGYWCRFFNGGTEICRIDLYDTIWRIEAGGATTNFSKPPSGTDITWDFKLSKTGGDFTFEVYTGGILLATQTWTSATAMPDRLVFDHHDMVWNVGASSYYYSEFIVTEDEPTLGWRLTSLDPLANGAHTAWDGDVLGITGQSDGLSISSDTVDARESWTLSAYAGPALTSGVRAVINKFVAGKGGGSGPQNIVPFTRHGATDQDGTSFSPDGKAHMEILDNDPNTAATWDTVNLASLQVGVKAAT